MAIEEFWQNLRTAARSAGPATDLPSPGSAPGAAAWLNSRSLDGFDAAEFAFLPPDQQQTLEDAVRRFRTIATDTPAGRLPTPARVSEARAAFAEILQILQPERFWDAESFRTHVGLNRELAGKLPKWVTGVTCETGFDHVGDPAIWIWVDVTDKAVDQHKIEKHNRQIRELVEAAYRSTRGHRWPFVRFRSPDAFAKGGAA